MSLLVAFAVVFVSGIVGVGLGAISGYFGGKADFTIQKLVEVVWAFPPLLLGITIMAFLGQGLFNLILALVAQRWIPYCRVVRGQALSLKTREFVVAAQCLGAGRSRIIIRHLLPNLIQTSMVQAAAEFGVWTWAQEWPTMNSALLMRANRGRSSVGRAPALQAGGRRFDPARLH